MSDDCSTENQVLSSGTITEFILGRQVLPRTCLERFVFTLSTKSAAYKLDGNLHKWEAFVCMGSEHFSDFAAGSSAKSKSAIIQ